MSASITTTLSVKNKASVEINKIQSELQSYQTKHKDLIASINKDNTSFSKSEKELANNIENYSSQKKQAILAMQKVQRESTKEQNSIRKQEIENLKKTYSDETKSLYERTIAIATLRTKDIQAARTYYDELIFLEKEKLTKTKQSNSESRAENNRVKALYEQKIQELNDFKSKQAIVLKEIDDAKRKSLKTMVFGQTPQASQASYTAKAKEGEYSQFQKEFVNSSQVNRYNDALERLNSLESKGIITSQEKQKALIKEKLALDESEKSTSNLANTTIRYLRWIGTLAGVYYGLTRAYQATVGAGIEINKMIEDNTNGIAALLAANTRMTLSNGQVVNSYEKFRIGGMKAAEIMENIRIASTKTFATYPQLTAIYQQMIGHTLSMGNSMGKTVDEISNNTIELSKILSNIGGSIGMEMQRINEEARSMISGNVSTDSIISTMIFGSPTEANEAIKKAKEKGVNGVKDMLMGVLESYKVLEGVKTYSRAQLELQDQISRSQELLSKPIYNALKDVYMELSTTLKQNEQDFKVWGERLLSIGKFIVEYTDDIAMIGGAVMAASLANKALGLSFDSVKTSMVAFAVSTEKTALATTAMSTGFTKAGLAMKSLIVGNAPLLIITAAYTAYEILIGKVIEREERLKKVRNESADSLNALSSSQLEQNKALLDEQFIKQTKLVQDAKATIANKGFFEKTKQQKDEEAYNLKAAETELDSLRKNKNETNQILTTRTEILKKQEKITSEQTKAAELQTKYAVNKKLEEDITTDIKKNEEEIVKLSKEKKAIADYLIIQENNLKDINKNAPKDIEARKQVENSITLAKAGILDKEKQIAEEKDKASKKQLSEIKQADNLNEATAQRAKLELELKSLKEGTYNTETYLVDQARLEVKLAEEKLSHLTGYDNILKASVELEQKKLDLTKAITTEKEKQDEKDRKALSFSKMNEFMTWSSLDMESLSQLEEGLKVTFEGDTKSLTALEKQIDKVKKQLYKEDLTLEIKFDGFDEVSSGIAEIANSFQDMQKEAAKYNQILKDKDADPIKRKQAQLDYSDTTITGYGNMIGALGSFYDADDERREKQQKMANLFYMAKMAMQISEMAQSTAFTSLFITQEAIKSESAAVTATMIAAQSSPWTGFATAAAMIALAASLGIAIGGKTKTSTSSDNFSAQKQNTGTNTVLGDTTKQSESIVNALSILQDFAQPQYQTLQLMNKHLENISSNIAGFSSLLIRQGGFAFGQGATEFDTGYKNNIGISSGVQAGLGLGLNATYGAGVGILTGSGALAGALAGTGVGAVAMIADKLLLNGAVSNLINSALNSVLGGLFGKTSVSQTLKDSGITFADTLLTSAIKEFNGQSYQTIETTTSKKSWFGSSSSTNISSYFENLDSETNRQFSMVMKNLYDTTILSGEALDTASSQIEQSLANFVIKVGKISLKDKTGDEIQQQIEAIFGQIGDDIAKTAFPLLTSFQKVGEGMFETLTRVATGMEEAEYYIGKLGKSFTDLSYTEILNKQGNVGFEVLLQSIVKTDEAVNGLDNNLVKIVESLDSTAEELYSTYTALDKIRNILKFLNTDTQTLSFASIKGAGSLESLASGIQAYTENFLTEAEQLSLSTTLLQTEFNKLNIAMPVGKTGFTNLIDSIDKTSTSGQELYGRLIILSESFANVADSVDEGIKTLQDSLKDKSQTMFDSFLTSISSMFNSIVGMAENTQNTILGIKTGDTGNTQETIYNKFVEYNKLLAKFEEAQKSGDIKTAETSYSSLIGMSNDLAQAGYKTEILGLLENKLAGFDTTKDILRVNVVDGLGTLINLTQDQTDQLQLAAKDGAVTNSELSSIAGLTEAQIASIKEFAKNSNYFSTEDTLSNLEQYAKLQLDAYKENIAQEQAGLSKSSFTYGDYIGTQEQIDISKKLGVSYDTAKPLIEKIQALSISKNLQSDIQSLMGYTGTSVNQTTTGQLDSLSSYLSSDIQNIISSTKDTTNTNLIAEQEKQKVFEAARADFYNRYGDANSYLNTQASESQNSWTNVLAHIHDEDKSAFPMDNVSSQAPSNPNQEYYKQGSYQGRWEDYVQQHNEAYSAYSYLQELLNEKAVKGYSAGGYTGDIPRNAISGFVHGQEHVLDANVTSAVNNIGSVTDMVNQYTSSNRIVKELANIKTVLSEQSRYFNGIIQKLEEQVRLLTDSKEIQNSSLIKLEEIEGVI